VGVEVTSLAENASREEDASPKEGASRKKDANPKDNAGPKKGASPWMTGPLVRLGVILPVETKRTKALLHPGLRREAGVVHVALGAARVGAHLGAHRCPAARTAERSRAMTVGPATPEPPQWWTGTPSATALGRAFFARPAQIVAPALLGARLVSTVDRKRTEGGIVEVEAYLGPSDPASHAATKSGRTPRNAIMFGPAGFAYVYLSYGVHWFLNVVTDAEGEAGAVLIRAVDPLDGIQVMSARRGRTRDLASGPGRVGQAFGVTATLNGHDLAVPPLQLLAGWSLGPSDVGESQRIGISRAKERLLRFFALNNGSVSRPRV
jgi:DNA-3-methyladenine glycosylase